LPDHALEIAEHGGHGENAEHDQVVAFNGHGRTSTTVDFQRNPAAEV
jgi:hypothetical protein